jgi:hypothetical protein
MPASGLTDVPSAKLTLALNTDSGSAVKFPPCVAQALFE